MFPIFVTCVPVHGTSQMDSEIWLTDLTDVGNGVQNVIKHPLTKLVKFFLDLEPKRAQASKQILDLQDPQKFPRGVRNHSKF